MIDAYPPTLRPIEDPNRGVTSIHQPAPDYLYGLQSHNLIIPRVIPESLQNIHVPGNFQETNEEGEEERQAAREHIKDALEFLQVAGLITKEQFDEIIKIGYFAGSFMTPNPDNSVDIMNTNTSRTSTIFQIIFKPPGAEKSMISDIEAEYLGSVSFMSINTIVDLYLTYKNRPENTFVTYMTQIIMNTRTFELESILYAYGYGFPRLDTEIPTQYPQVEASRFFPNFLRGVSLNYFDADFSMMFQDTPNNPSVIENWLGVFLFKDELFLDLVDNLLNNDLRKSFLALSNESSFDTNSLVNKRIGQATYTELSNGQILVSVPTYWDYIDSNGFFDETLLSIEEIFPGIEADLATEIRGLIPQRQKLDTSKPGILQGETIIPIIIDREDLEYAANILEVPLDRLIQPNPNIPNSFPWGVVAVLAAVGAGGIYLGAKRMLEKRNARGVNIEFSADLSIPLQTSLLAILNNQNTTSLDVDTAMRLLIEIYKFDTDHPNQLRLMLYNSVLELTRGNDELDTETISRLIKELKISPEGLVNFLRSDINTKIESASNINQDLLRYINNQTQRSGKKTPKRGGKQPVKSKQVPTVPKEYEFPQELTPALEFTIKTALGSDGSPVSVLEQFKLLKTLLGSKDVQIKKITEQITSIISSLTDQSAQTEEVNPTRNITLESLSQRLLTNIGDIIDGLSETELNEFLNANRTISATNLITGGFEILDALRTKAQEGLDKIRQANREQAAQEKHVEVVTINGEELVLNKKDIKIGAINIPKGAIKEVNETLQAIRRDFNGQPETFFNPNNNSRATAFIYGRAYQVPDTSLLPSEELTFIYDNPGKCKFKVTYRLDTDDFLFEIYEEQANKTLDKPSKIQKPTVSVRGELPFEPEVISNNIVKRINGELSAPIKNDFLNHTEIVRTVHQNLVLMMNDQPDLFEVFYADTGKKPSGIKLENFQNSIARAMINAATGKLIMTDSTVDALVSQAEKILEDSGEILESFKGQIGNLRIHIGRVKVANEDKIESIKFKIVITPHNHNSAR